MLNCVFSYYVSESDIEIEELKHKCCFGKYIMLTDVRTPISYACNDKSECVVFGYAVNVFTKECDNIADKIISCCFDISDVIEFEKSLGGKYIIIFRSDENYWFLGDATHSIPVFYNLDGKFACSSNLNYLVTNNKYFPDQKLLNIRESGDISQAMPFDITQYKEIKQLLPNHYLSINERKTIRFINSVQSQPALSVDEATSLAKPLIETMCEFYKQRFCIKCPITSGRDSRVVLAFLASRYNDVLCYTIRHPEFHSDSQNIVIPKRLCEEFNLPYEQINDVIVSNELMNKMNQLLGENNYSPRTLRIAQTIFEHFGSSAIVNGDIIGQVGKCSLHRDIPLCFALPSYFQCKLHNYSRDAKRQLKLWMEEIRNSGERINMFDLFSVENRMGRWAGQENLIYNSIGQIYLNIFNSRSIIYLWTAVSRKERKFAKLQVGLIKDLKPELLTIPFEKDENLFIRLSKLNGITYLLSSYAKYYMEFVKFKMR